MSSGAITGYTVGILFCSRYGAIAYPVAASNPPATVCTFSCSTRRRIFVKAPVGSGSESSTITFTSRPATLYPTSSQNSVKPSVMSLPVCEKFPVSGPKYPMRMGPRSAPRPADGLTIIPAATAPVATRNARLCMEGTSCAAERADAFGQVGAASDRAAPSARPGCAHDTATGRPVKDPAAGLAGPDLRTDQALDRVPELLNASEQLLHGRVEHERWHLGRLVRGRDAREL